ncbi:hypothetical protein [Planktothricoides raciborskii]|uniref:Uncharacterized protein n=1 Tax=Planktothricoides raciborskii GIHE-MW2 TaxID=2792601 RepID=A0AAU8J5N4_9CYAN
MANGKLQTTLKGHKSAVLTIAFSPDHNLLVSGSADGQIKIWRWDPFASNYVPQRTLNSHRDAVFALDFSTYGQKFASASADDTIKIWRYNSDLSKTIKAQMGGVFGLSFMPKGKLIAVWGGDGTVKGI